MFCIWEGMVLLYTGMLLFWVGGRCRASVRLCRDMFGKKPCCDGWVYVVGCI